MKRRWLYTSGGTPLPEPVEVTPDFQATPERSGNAFMVDRFMEGAVTTDGVDIGSRSRRREYMKAHGVTDSSDYSGHLAKAAERRAAIFRGEDSTDYRPALQQAWETQGKRR